MKQLLITIAAVVLVGCGESVPDISIHDAAANGNIEAVKQHIAAGCLCDPHGVELNWFGDEKVIDGVRLPIVCKARGASALEGFHTHQKAWLGPLARHTSDVGEALLADGALRWNRHSVRRRAVKHASLYAPGMRQELAAGCTYAQDEPQLRSPTDAWTA